MQRHVKIWNEGRILFSLLDWSHPDYDPTGSGISYPKGNYEAQKQGRRQFGNHEKYKDYLYNIFNELLTSYAPVDLVWWDFSQPGFQGDKAWNATALMKNLFEKIPRQFKIIACTILQIILVKGESE